MAELFETQERTEEATAKRREDARARGQFARSADLSTAVALIVTVAVLLLFGGSLLRGMSRELVAGLQRLSNPVSSAVAGVDALRSTLYTAARFTMPFLLFAMAAGVTLHVVQAGGFFLARDALSIKLDRLDPTANFGRMLSLRSFVKVGSALLKLAVIVAVLAYALRGRLEEIGALASMDLESAAPKLGALLLALLLRVTSVLLVIGALDWIYQRWQHTRDLRMSKQQVRDEQKQEDGDGQAKRRIRDRLRKLIEKPLRQAVGEATVVVTNPTHFAVALQYVEGKSAAPAVVAKGVDRIAEEIKRIARDANVPVIEQPPLARALFRDVQVGQAIPEALYRAVAAVLAIVWRLREEKKRRAVQPAGKPSATAPKAAARAAGRGRS